MTKSSVVEKKTESDRRTLGLSCFQLSLGICRLSLWVLIINTVLSSDLPLKYCLSGYLFQHEIYSCFFCAFVVLSVPLMWDSVWWFYVNLFSLITSNCGVCSLYLPWKLQIIVNAQWIWINHSVRPGICGGSGKQDRKCFLSPIT